MMHQMTLKTANIWATALLVLFVLSGCASQQQTTPSPSESTVDLSKLQKNGTFSFSGRAYNLIAGGTWGEGVLNYNGKSYPFKAKSIGVGYAVGVKDVNVKGTVYNLNSVGDFAGTYWGVKAAGTVGVGAGAASLENKNDVVLGLQGTSKGVAVDIAAGLARVVVEFK